jgi:cytochrome b subunit of formate dehydrogenase
MEHWGTAAGIFILIISGFQVRFYKGFAATNLHYLGLFLTLLFGTYFAADFIVSKKWELLPDEKDIIDGTIKKYLFHIKSKETGKYLSSQKSSFLAFVVLGGQILISGTIKVLVFYMHIPTGLLQVATWVHDVSALLFGLILIVHVFLVLTNRENRVLLRSWFTGKVPEEPLPETVSKDHIEPEKLTEPAVVITPVEPVKPLVIPVVPAAVVEKVKPPVVIIEPEKVIEAKPVKADIAGILTDKNKPPEEVTATPAVDAKPTVKPVVAPVAVQPEDEIPVVLPKKKAEEVVLPEPEKKTETGKIEAKKIEPPSV